MLDWCPQLGHTLEGVTVDMLGTCERAVVSKDKTTIVTAGRHANAIAERMKTIKAEVM